MAMANQADRTLSLAPSAWLEARRASIRGKAPLTLRRRRDRRAEGCRRWAAAILLSVLSVALSSPVLASAWDRVDWGMTSNDLAAIYGARALRLGSPIVFGDSYSDIVLRDQPFANYPFRVYFQMDKTSGRLAHVLLERRRQYATRFIFDRVVETLRRELGPETERCGDAADRGKPTSIDLLWRRSDETVVLSFLDFAAEILEYSNDPARRILIRYSPAGDGGKACTRR
jgi:hypothetical protein